jgi:hypothetical protein
MNPSRQIKPINLREADKRLTLHAGRIADQIDLMLARFCHKQGLSAGSYVLTVGVVKDQTLLLSTVANVPAKEAVEILVNSLTTVQQSLQAEAVTLLDPKVIPLGNA